MSESTEISVRERRVVGTAGHIDHGKTTLVRAITGVDCDRLPEEKRRGITIDLGFANWNTEDLQIGFVDVPGHERFVRNMLAGAGGIDSVLLVVAADESIMPQTLEHFEICRLLQVTTGVVAITKADLVDREIVELVRLEVEELVRGSFLENRPIIPVGSTIGEGVDELKAALARSIREAPARDAEAKVFRLPIDRVFTMKGFGSVVTGTTVSGLLAVDREIEILPGERRSRARNIQVHGEPREIARAGERTSINLSDVAVSDLSRGEQVVEPDTLHETRIVTVNLQLLGDAPPLRNQARVRFHLFSSEVIGSIRLLGRGKSDDLRPGESAWAQIHLEAAVVAVRDDRFIIRRYSPMTTIGGGRILDPHLGKLPRSTRAAILEKLASADLSDALVPLARFAGIGGLTIEALVARTGLVENEVRDRIRRAPRDDLVDAGDDRLIHREVLQDVRRRAMATLQIYFRENRMTVGMPKGELLQKILPPASEQAILAFVLSDLEKEKIITISGDLIDVPGRSKELGGREGEVAEAIERRFRDAGLQVPPVSELIRELNQKPKVIEGVISYLVRRGALVRIADGIYLHPEIVAGAAKELEKHRGESVDVAFFKDLFGITRKVVIPLLEHFDAVGLTRRIGDRREVR